MKFFVKKKYLNVLICCCVILSSLFLNACDSKETAVEPVDVLLITDIGTVEDGSYNQGAWDGIKKYAEESGVICNYYEPKETTLEGYLDEIERGVDNGAKVIVCPGYLHEESVYEASKEYPDVSFVLLDGTPHNSDFSDETIAPNVKAILFAEEQAGFLAGYSAVRDGYTGLGFMGGVPEEPVIKFGYGFVQGADYAAIEMGEEVHIRYTYTNTYYEDNDVENVAKTWFGDDTEIIFACGGAMGRSVMHAAEECDKKVIGVDVDQSNESEKVVTSAMKSLSSAVYNELKNYYAGTFKGGEVTRLGAKDNGICLPMDTSRFEKFTAVDYNNIYQLLVDGSIEPYCETNVGTTSELSLVNTTVSYINFQ